MTSALIGVITLLPTMIGPLPQPTYSASLITQLCNGGTTTIPLRGKNREEPVPCQPKGCHSGCTRKRFDPSQ